FRPLLLLSVCWLFGSAVATAQLANRPPVPEWLKGASVSHQFDAPEQLLMAILLVASPDADVTVLLNGTTLATLPKSEQATSLDITRHLRTTANTLTLQSTGKVAALLELNGDLAKKTWIATNRTWGNSQTLGPTDAIADTDPFDLK